MANGNGVERNGFKDPALHAKSVKGENPIGTEWDDQIKGSTDAAVSDLLDGNEGDDVIIAYAGDDTAFGGTGRDNLAGGAGDDTLIGGAWNDDEVEGDVEGDTGTVGMVDADEVVQDSDRDTFVAASSFEANGTDTILLYDEPEEVLEGEVSVSDAIDLTDAFVLNVTDTDLSGTVEQAEIDAALAAMVSYDASTGALSIGGSVWFNVFEDYAGTDAADSIVIEVDVSVDGGVTTTATEFTL